MKKSDYLILFLGGVVVGMITLFTRHYTGYMDADYYYATGRELAAGHGFTQNFLWNFLDNPTGLPHPSFTYWMPLSSIIAAIGMYLLGSSEFIAARFPFVIIYGLVPGITAFIAYRISNIRLVGWLAGALCIFCGFYLRYISEPDSFGISMILGTLIIIISSSNVTGWRIWLARLIVGVLAGLMHMSRADGLLWVGIGIMGFVIVSLKPNEGKVNKPNFLLDTIISSIAFVFIGYLVVTLPWYLRNYELFNAIFPPGNSKALFLREYDQLFSYPASTITYESWWGVGFGNLLLNILSSLGTNMVSALVVQGNIVMLPLAVIGIVKSWKTPAAKLTVFSWLIIFISMSVAFPFAGKRGGFLHSGAALQPLIWIYSVIGLRIAIEKGVKARKWDEKSAAWVFNSFLLAVALFISGYIIRGDILNQKNLQTGMLWSEYQKVDNYLLENDQGKSFRVMVNNPAAYNVVTQRQAVILPYGDLSTMITVATVFNIDYLVLDKNVIESYRGLYEHPSDIEGLIFLDKVSDFRVYRFQ